MNAVKSILQQQLDGCSKVDVDGGHVNIVVMIFLRVASVRQQLVYAALQEHIASGVIHAVN